MEKTKKLLDEVIKELQECRKLAEMEVENEGVAIMLAMRYAVLKMGLEKQLNDEMKGLVVKYAGENGIPLPGVK